MRRGLLNDALRKPFSDLRRIARDEVADLAAEERQFYEIHEHAEMCAIEAAVEKHDEEWEGDWEAADLRKQCSICSRQEPWNRTIVRFEGPIVPRGARPLY